MNHLKIGARVRFASRFLNSTGQFTGEEAPTSTGPWARGEVIKAQQFSGIHWQLMTVRWEDGREKRVMECNLEACR